MNDNIMSTEEIEEMLKNAGQIDDDAVGDEAAKGEESTANQAAEEQDAQGSEGQPEADAPQQESAAQESASAEDESSENDADKVFNKYDYLSKEEEDVLGEIGNICMGTSATTMCTLLGRRVDITTPRVSIHDPKSLARGYKAPMVVVDVNYIQGITGKNLLILDEYDVAMMTDALMGGDGSGIERGNITLDEMHMSAIREVMNQMVGSSATSLANIINTTVDISTPTAHHISLDEGEIKGMFSPDEMLVKISFDMVIEGLLESKIMQIIPLDFAKNLANKLMGNQSSEIVANEAMDKVVKSEIPSVEQIQSESPAAAQSTPAAQSAPSPASVPAPAPAPVPQMQGGGMGAATNNVVRGGENAKEVEYPNFDAIVGPGYAPVPENIALLSNVPMRVTVQLGKARKKVKEILEFNNGSVIVLDKLAGEPVDILVNGKHIAKGEVVVVDDSYGVRITEIDSAAINEM